MFYLALVGALLKPLEESEAVYLAKAVPGMSFKQVDIQYALKKLCSLNRIPYSVGDGVDGIVDISLKEGTFGVDLKKLLQPAGCSYKFSNGTFAIYRDLGLPCRLKKYQFRSGDAIDGIERILDTVEANYWISPDIRGKVQFEYGTGSFEETLDRVVKLAGAEYRYDDGVFVVYALGHPTRPITKEKLGGTFFRELHWIFYHHADIREVLKTYFQSFNGSYSLDSKVQGLINLKLRDLPYEYVLEYILLGSGAQSKFENETFVITAKANGSFKQGIRSAKI